MWPGRTYYDEFLDDFFLLLERIPDRHGRPSWRTLTLLSGEQNVTLESMLQEDPDVEWLT